MESEMPDLTNDDIRQLLDKHSAALAEAEQMRCVWAEKAEGLRQVVAGYKRLLKAQDPRQQALRIATEDMVQAEEPARTETTLRPAEAVYRLSAPPRQGPRGEEAVRRLLQEAAPRPQSPKDLTEAIVSRGWIRDDAKGPEDAVRAALGRMINSGKVVRVGTGLYTLPPANGSAAPAESDEGGQ
jgi:hypothetical protein